MATTTDAKAPRKPVDIAPTFSRRWSWLLVLGIVQVIAGVLAIALPVIASLIATAAFAWILIIAGIMHLVHAFAVRQWRGFLLHMIGGALYLVAGALLLLKPLSGVATLALVVGVLLIAEGVLRSVLAFSVRPRDGWGWFLAAGISSIVLGGIMFVGWPATSLLFVGWLLGFQLVFSGAMNASCALVCRGCRNSLSSDSDDQRLAAAH